MPYEILIHQLAADEIELRRAYDQRRVLTAIEELLGQQPNVPTRRRKCLVGLTPQFEHVPPVWELRVGELRVFYDIDEQARQVNVRAVRRKDAQHMTEEIT